MVTLRIATQEEKQKFLNMFRKQLGKSERSALDYLGLSWDKLAELFVTIGEVRAVCENGEVTGFVWIELRETEVHVHAIVLDPQFRGRGIGRCVFQELEQEFSEAASVIELGVQEENASAIGFYHKVGFRPAEKDTATGFLILQKPIPRGLKN